MRMSVGFSGLKGLMLRFMLTMFVLFFLVSISALPVMAGCCIYEGICQPEESGCPPASYIAGEDVLCSDQPACQTGCCCPEGEVMRRGACSDYDDFNVDPLLTSGSSCSCDIYSQYTIRGTVRKDGYGLGGVPVSAGSISTISDASGTVGNFVLNNVPGGPVTIVASDGDCTGTHAIPSLSQDISGVAVDLECTCTPGCDVAAKSFCDSQSNLHEYNISLPSELSAYCQFCAGDDPGLCGLSSECRAGDMACPLECSADPGNSEYDPDCVCDANAKNGYCPPGCTEATDLDCTSLDLVCGDGNVFYPFETCEPFLNPGQIGFCSAEACEDCNCVSDETCGNGRIDSGEQCELGNICNDGSPCLDCKCTGSCTESSKKPAIAATYTKATQSILITWSLSPACRSIVQSYTVKYCKRGETNCNDVADFRLLTNPLPVSQSEFVFSPIEGNSVYSFFITAQYNDNSVASSSITRITTGTEFCMNRAPDAAPEFCMFNKRSICDSNNNIQAIEDCESKNLYCSGPDRTGATTCELVDSCTLCNGLYGMFSVYLDLKVDVDGESMYCNPKIEQPNRQLVSGCYLDKTKSIFPAFKSCGSVISCYDYKSEEACTDPWDPCNMNQNCEWVSFDFNPELGGVCRPVSPSLQDCTLCDDSDANWLSPKCTPAVCFLFGNCYYQGADNNPTCSSTEVHMCTEYLTRDACIGTGASAHPVYVDAVYDTYNKTKRVGGTHEFTPSGGELSYGKCYWDATNERCRRNADGLPVVWSGSTVTGLDCSSKDYFCESDFSNPETILLPSASGFYPASPKIRFDVQDNYPADMIRSFFCLSSVNEPDCYPSDEASGNPQERYFEAYGLDVSGDYNLFYYSMDGAKNLEVVKKAQIKVDAEAPFIELLSPKNESGIGTNLKNLPVFGRTATDVSYLCVENLKIKKKYCINNCLKRGVSGECIGNDGVFNITVPIVLAGSTTTSTSSEVVRDIVFEAVDFAGNVYKNTLLGVMYDIYPPEAPTIVIK
ncbi:hypothetical protein JW711_06305 [Candidatus Woesearchaeota archaeon]|nr:hypothetical protein [Candidatus Woesearchaeota archaeon]